MGRNLESLFFGLNGKDPVDPRDYLKTVDVDAKVEPIDLSRIYGIEPTDQSGNSCTGHSNAKLVQLITAKATGSNLRYSANYSYLKNRKNPHHDRGALMRDAAISLVKFGVCAHEIWPDHLPPVPVPEEVNEVLPERCFKVPRMERVEHDADLMCRILSVEKLPIKCGRQLWRSGMEQALNSRNGFYPVTTQQTDFLGHHDELIVGWNLIGSLRYFKLVGSWGLDVGDRGFMWFPESYLNTAMIADMWAPGREIF